MTADYVVNFAAESHVDGSIKEPEIFVRTNVLGTVNLLNAASMEENDTFKRRKEVYSSIY